MTMRYYETSLTVRLRNAWSDPALQNWPYFDPKWSLVTNAGHNASCFKIILKSFGHKHKSAMQ